MVQAVFFFHSGASYVALSCLPVISYLLHYLLLVTWIWSIVKNQSFQSLFRCSCGFWKRFSSFLLFTLFLFHSLFFFSINLIKSHLYAILNGGLIYVFFFFSFFFLYIYFVIIIVIIFVCFLYLPASYVLYFLSILFLLSLRFSMCVLSLPPCLLSVSLLHAFLSLSH